MIIKLIINTLFFNIILFINNYFNNLKLIIILKVKEIAMCEIMKLIRKKSFKFTYEDEIIVF